MDVLRISLPRVNLLKVQGFAHEGQISIIDILNLTEKQVIGSIIKSQTRTMHDCAAF